MSFAMTGITPPLRISQPEPMSLDDFWRVALENPDLRIEREPNGDVTLMSPAHGTASVYSSYVFGKLFMWAEVEGRGYALDSSAGCQLPDGSVRSPDASWISASRWTPKPITDDAPVPCPDFVIEVRSGSDRLKPAQEKMQAWIANGVQLAWLIDPIRRIVEIHRPGQQPEIQEGQSASYGEGPVRGFVLELGRIWG
jgi:Uma2 family endonuclease